MNKHNRSKTWDSVTPLERPVAYHFKTGADPCKWTLLPIRIENKRHTDVGHIPAKIGAQ